MSLIDPNFDANTWLKESDAYWRGYNQAEKENYEEPTDLYWIVYPLYFIVVVGLGGLLIWLITYFL